MGRAAVTGECRYRTRRTKINGTVHQLVQVQGDPVWSAVCCGEIALFDHEVRWSHPPPVTCLECVGMSLEERAFSLHEAQQTRREIQTSRKEWERKRERLHAYGVEWSMYQPRRFDRLKEALAVVLLDRTEPTKWVRRPRLA